MKKDEEKEGLISEEKDLIRSNKDSFKMSMIFVGTEDDDGDGVGTPCKLFLCDSSNFTGKGDTLSKELNGSYKDLSGAFFSIARSKLESSSSTVIALLDEETSFFDDLDTADSDIIKDCSVTESEKYLDNDYCFLIQIKLDRPSPITYAEGSLEFKINVARMSFIKTDSNHYLCVYSDSSDDVADYKSREHDIMSSSYFKSYILDDSSESKIFDPADHFSRNEHNTRDSLCEFMRTPYIYSSSNIKKVKSEPNLNSNLSKRVGFYCRKID